MVFRSCCIGNGLWEGPDLFSLTVFPCGVIRHLCVGEEEAGEAFPVRIGLCRAISDAISDGVNGSKSPGLGAVRRREQPDDRG